MAAVQQASSENPENRVKKDSSYFTLDVLSVPVRFSLFATADGKYWAVGTFYDSQYVYTISYVTIDTSEDELKNFTDLLRAYLKT